MTFDLVIRGGFVVDGTGAAGRPGDVAVVDGTIVAVGEVDGRGRREIDADGRTVTPGFVDIHTHFDGQATWDPILAPSSVHGVTTVAMGNCGVGFAPARADRHDWLIGMLEGVEDIPGTALAEGLPWDWESFPDYLDSLERRSRTIDVGTHVPHAALRGYVMGARGADPAEVPTGAEAAAMAEAVGEGLEAGAIGFATSRTTVHRTAAGDRLGTLRAGEDELLVIAEEMHRRNLGVIQLISDCYRSPDMALVESELAMIRAMATVSGRPLSFTVQQSHELPERWRDLLGFATGALAAGLDVKAQVASRPIGVLLGLAATVNPFSRCPSYREVADLPLDQRLVALGDPALRSRILAEHATPGRGPGEFSFSDLSAMYVLGDPVGYDLEPSRSVTALAAAAGEDPAAYVYRLLTAGDGGQLLYFPLFNFAGRTMDVVAEMVASPVALFGLSDAGAHCGAICDASMSTSALTLWGRSRDEGGLGLEGVVHHLTQRTAAHVGWADRGVVAPGYLADLNVIDLDALGCRPPTLAWDLPAGGRRLVQEATGYSWTVKSGVPTFCDGQQTGELPGRLVRGARPFPV
jgi:N-acyl-D-aspartate/D-glutamate deacylase